MGHSRAVRKPKKAPRTLQDGPPSGPRNLQEGSQVAQDGPKAALREFKKASKELQDGSEVAQDGPQDGFKRAPESHKTASSWPPSGPSWTTWGHRETFLDHLGTILKLIIALSCALLKPSWGHPAPFGGHIQAFLERSLTLLKPSSDPYWAT